MDKCKYCGNEKLILENPTKDENILTADKVALKCANCGRWLKWCPKNERQQYIQNKTQTDKWEILKNWLIEIKEKGIKYLAGDNKTMQLFLGRSCRKTELMLEMCQETIFANWVLDKMNEIETKGEENDT